jgi:curli biogenesis system outer membrane secretion channel CsgG
MNNAIFGICLALASLVPLAASAQERPVLAVIEFRNDSGAGWFRGGVGWELAGMLTNELSATGAFRVVERSKLQAVLEEQDLAASGRVRPGTGAQIGRLTGAQYLVSGTVTSYEENTKGSRGGVSFRGVSVGGKSSEAYLAVDIRVINTETGEIDFVRTVEGRSKSGGMSVGVYKGGFGGSLAEENNTPVGKAIRAALVEVTDYLECAMVKQDSCLQTYDARESRRRDSSRGALKFD